jgi:hypothetical protein
MASGTVKSLSDRHVRNMAERVAGMLNAHMLEFPNNTNLLEFVLTELFGSQEAFQEEFYSLLSADQQLEFRALVDRMAQEQREKKLKFFKLLNVKGFKDIIDGLQKAHVGKASRVEATESFRPDASPRPSGQPGSGKKSGRT